MKTLFKTLLIALTLVACEKTQTPEETEPQPPAFVLTGSYVADWPSDTITRMYITRSGRYQWVLPQHAFRLHESGTIELLYPGARLVSRDNDTNMYYRFELQGDTLFSLDYDSVAVSWFKYI
jgi:hypothetical protein